MNPETHEQAIEVGFYRAPRHIQLLGNFIVIAALQEQFHDLPLPWPQRFLLHDTSPLAGIALPQADRTGIYQSASWVLIM
jgi:hypothetical protein